MKAGVLRLCLFQNGDFSIGIFPQRKEILVCDLGSGGSPRHLGCPATCVYEPGNAQENVSAIPPQCSRRGLPLRQPLPLPVPTIEWSEISQSRPKHPPMRWKRQILLPLWRGRSAWLPPPSAAPAGSRVPSPSYIALAPPVIFRGPPRLLLETAANKLLLA